MYLRFTRSDWANQKNKMRTLLPPLFLSAFLLTSCLEKRTSDAEEAFEYWSGMHPKSDIKILNGQYWESAHWSKEYKVYLEMQTNPEWVAAFVKQNDLKIKTSDVTKLYDSPDWFQPRSGLKAYEPSDFSQGSLYFVDKKTGYILFYEIQL